MKEAVNLPVDSIEREEYHINMGPQHPSTHGVLRLVVTLQGEIVKKVQPHCGYINRGIEKMCEKDTYQQTSTTMQFAFLLKEPCRWKSLNVLYISAPSWMN